MRKLDLKIDVTAACRTEERIDCAVTVIAPEPAEIRSAPVVMFGWPGGGYNRSYFDLHVAGAEGYSQAEFHAGAGVIFVACDHVAVGDSTVPNAGLDHPDIARANRAVVAALVEELRNGALLEGLVAHLDRRNRWEMSVTDRHIYIAVGGDTVEGDITRHSVS